MFRLISPPRRVRRSAGEPGIQFQIEPIVSIDAVRPLWRELEAAGATSFFVSWTWTGTWLGCLPPHVRPLLLTGSRDGEILGAAVIVPKESRRFGVASVRTLHLNSTGEPELDCVTVEHNGFIGSAEAQRLLCPGLLRWFSQQSEFDRLCMPCMSEGIVPKRTGGAWLLREERSASAYRCKLPKGGMEAIVGGLSRNARQQLRRDMRLAGEAGELICKCAKTAETALDWFDALKELHIRSWNARGRPHAFRHPFFQEFHRQLIARGIPERSVELLRISVGDIVLGYLYNFRLNGRVLAYQSGFDPSHRQCRPGYISHLLAMARSADEVACSYDFLAGDNQLKRTFANERYSTSSWRLARPGGGVALESGARLIAQKLAPARAWAARCLAGPESDPQ